MKAEIGVMLPKIKEHQGPRHTMAGWGPGSGEQDSSAQWLQPEVAPPPKNLVASGVTSDPLMRTDV